MTIAKLMLAFQNYRFSPEGEKALVENIPLRRSDPTTRVS